MDRRPVAGRAARRAGVVTVTHGLKPQPLAILAFIHAYVAERQESPTTDEIAAARGIGRTTVATHLGVLEARGYLRRARANGKPGQRLALTTKPCPIPVPTTTESAAA